MLSLNLIEYRRNCTLYLRFEFDKKLLSILFAIFPQFFSFQCQRCQVQYQSFALFSEHTHIICRAGRRSSLNYKIELFAFLFVLLLTDLPRNARPRFVLFRQVIQKNARITIWLFLLMDSAETANERFSAVKTFGDRNFCENRAGICAAGNFSFDKIFLG